LGEAASRRGRCPGLVTLLLCGLLVCASGWGQGSATGPAGHVTVARDAAGPATRAEPGLKPWTEIRWHRGEPLYARPAGLLLFLPGPLFLLAVLLPPLLPPRLRRGWPAFPLLLLLVLPLGARDEARDPGRLAEQAAAAYARGEIRSAADIFAGLEQDFPGNPALMYNLAVCYHRLGQRGQAVFLLRRSLAESPGDRVIRATLSALEREYGLDAQLGLPPPLSAGLPYYLAACLSNLAFAAGALFIRRRRVQLLILVVLLAAGALISLGSYLALESRERRPVGVVAAAAAELKTIPRAGAQSRLELAEGTSLYVLGEDERFMLVETSFGFKGWVQKRMLLID
jgi:tetratricopeptide (TPR) repeat protein